MHFHASYANMQLCNICILMLFIQRCISTFHATLQPCIFTYTTGHQCIHAFMHPCIFMHLVYSCIPMHPHEHMHYAIMYPHTHALYATMHFMYPMHLRIYVFHESMHSYNSMHHILCMTRLCIYAPDASILSCILRNYALSMHLMHPCVLCNHVFTHFHAPHAYMHHATMRPCITRIYALCVYTFKHACILHNDAFYASHAFTHLRIHTLSRTRCMHCTSMHFMHDATAMHFSRGISLGDRQFALVEACAAHLLELRLWPSCQCSLHPRPQIGSTGVAASHDSLVTWWSPGQA